jgi:hypothetical protein
MPRIHKRDVALIIVAPFESRGYPIQTLAR